MLKYTGFMPRIEELTWMFDEGSAEVLLTVRLVPLVPPGKFTVAPAAGKPMLVAVAEEATVPVPVIAVVDLLTADPLSGEVVR
jgi:hypothetical protein